MAGWFSNKVEFSREKSPENGAGTGHILVIRLSAMGDVAMLVPVLRVVSKAYPRLQMTVLTRGFYGPIFKEIPNVQVYEADVSGMHAGVIGLSRLAKELRDLDIDAVADMHDVLRSNILNAVFKLYGIPVKQIDKGRKEKKLLTASTNKVFRPLTTTHNRYKDVFNELGLSIDLSKHQYPAKPSLPNKVREVINYNGQKLIGIAPFAQHLSKVYPLDLLEKVIVSLNEEPETTILLFGGGRAEKEKLETLAGKRENVISLAGKFTFEQELELIANLDCMLSMDSGNGHLAAMYGVPVITLWGVTHPFAGFRPYGQPQENSLLPNLEKYPAIPTSIYGNKVPEGYEDVMRSIPPEQVLDRIKNPGKPK